MGIKLLNYFNNFNTTQKYNLFNMVVFKVLFFSSMFASTNLFILFLNSTQQQHYISVYYTTMAFIGIGAIFLVKIFDKFKSKNIIKIGVLLYTLGLMLRAYPNNIVIIIVSAISAAVGANLVILGSRLWLLYFKDTNVRAKSVTTLSSVTNVTKNIVLYIVGFIIIFGYRWPLLIIAVFALLAIFFIPNIQTARNKNKAVSVKAPLKVLLIFSIVNFVAGIIGFILVTLLPILLQNKGLNESNALFYIATLGTTNVIFSLLVSAKINNNNLIKVYYIYCILLSAILFIALNNNLIGYWVIAIFFMLQAFLGSVGLSVDLIDNAIAENYNPTLLLALMQSTNLAGSFTAGMVSVYIINNNFSITLLLVLSSLLFVSNISMVWLFNSSKAYSFYN